jgi:hypothetical protein
LNLVAVEVDGADCTL